MRFQGMSAPLLVSCNERHAHSRQGWWSVAGDLAAVDMKDLAGNERRRLQEKDAVDDVADLAHVPYRRELGAETGIALRRMHRRLDDAWRDGVHPDAAGGILDGE